MKRIIIILTVIMSVVSVAMGQVAMESPAVGPVNYTRELFDAAHRDSTTIRINGESDEDSTGVYFHEPFTTLLLHVEGTSPNIIVGVCGGITKNHTTLGYADTTLFRFTADAILDTITAAGDYRYQLSIEQAMHIYFTLDGTTGNGSDTTAEGHLVRRKYN